jgi:hypothetical protein
MPAFDVFVSYNRSDSHDAERLVEGLARLKLGVFFDRTELLPGGAWREEVATALRESRSIAVLQGRNGLGPIQKKELEFALEEEKRRGVPVFTVLLPGAEPPKETTWVGLNTYVDLSKGVDNPVELSRIKLAADKGTPREGPNNDESAPKPDSSQVAVIENAIGALIRRFKESDVTFFLGSDLSTPPGPSEMAMRLTRKLREKAPWVPEMPALDVAGAIYAVACNDDLAVETEIGDLRRESPPLANSAHDDLAIVARHLTDRSRPKKTDDGKEEEAAGGQFQQTRRALLIVTTNHDLLMERALLRAAVPFRRIVQYASDARLDVSNFDVVAQGIGSLVVSVSDHKAAAVVTRRSVFRDDLATLDEVIATRVDQIAFNKERTKQGKNPLSIVPMVSPSLKRGIEVVLYKAYGSCDRSGSCAISCDHHYRFALKNVREGMIPTQIVDTVKNSPTVVLGYNLFDPGFRVVSHTLLANRLQGTKTYVVRPKPVAKNGSFENQIEAGFWEDVQLAWSQRGATFVETSERTFLTRLGARVSELTPPL